MNPRERFGPPSAAIFVPAQLHNPSQTGNDHPKTRPRARRSDCLTREGWGIYGTCNLCNITYKGRNGRKGSHCNKCDHCDYCDHCHDCHPCAHHHCGGTKSAEADRLTIQSAS